MTSSWIPIREPLGVTLRRTFAIALIVGGVIAWRFGSLRAWPVLSGQVLWFSFGGHWVDLMFLNGLRPRLSSSRAVQVAVRLAIWFVGGVVLGQGVVFTMRLSAFTAGIQPPPWWVAGVGFIAVELVAHGALAMRQTPNFYNGAG